MITFQVDSLSKMSEDIAVTKFREYLRINTEQPNPDYGLSTLLVFLLECFYFR